ncbi:Sulfide dehydrogenase [flavocytochrome C] flavoprotein chain precursor [hydrothermal vent metagenome]|uniref:Sulfide dehydrogenase [flavocytochrome C] flavoprotein chain n=1 Tax=hydrothermal vent metagenome TaxID=652676 RepID=A0A3B1EA77_9ZZZZ
MNRRDLFKTVGVTAVASVIGGCTTANVSATNIKSTGLKANLPKNGKGQRVVIVGGGWSGLSIAKRVKKYTPDADVVLIDQRAHFVSCPISNLWLVDQVDLEFLTHSFIDAAKNNGYTFFNASVYGVDKKSKTVMTTQGSLNYDYLVLAPGIDYDYSRWTKGDANLEYDLRTQYPAGFITHSEHQTIKEKIKNFKGGNFILTTPGGNYRCLPAPYERTCLIADYFKKNKIKGKVILLDENPDITIKKKGFHSAFNDMYKDYVKYVPSSKIEKFDLKKKIVYTEFDEYKFEDAAFYPHIRGGKLLEIAGVAKDAINKMEADINPFTYEVNGHPSIYCAGDARPMGFSKSGNTSNTEGHVVAKSITSHIRGAKFKWSTPHTTCFSAVAAHPIRAISVDADYNYNKKNKVFGFANASTDENWKGEHGEGNGEGLMGWAKGMYFDMFSV